MTTPNQTLDLSQLRIDPEARDRPKLSFKGRTIGVGIGVLLLIAVIGLATGRIRLRPVAVQVTKVSLVTPSQAATVLTAAGYVVARSKAEISPKAVGRISWLHLEEGQKVKKGELVARLESQEWQAQKRQVQASLEQARRDRDRYQKSLDEGAVSRQAFEAIDTQVKTLQAQNEYFDEQIRNAEIFSPIDGVVTVKKAYLGETVSPQGFGGSGSAGATFAVIVDFDTLEMEADISEANLGRMSLGQPAEITLDAYPGKIYAAKLRQIVPTADRQKGAVLVKVEFLQRDEKILPEMSARVAFLEGERPKKETRSKVMAPTASVVTIDGKEGLLVVKDQKAVFTPIKVGERTSAQVEVLEGALGGESIVAEAATSGIHWKENQTVRVLEK